MKMRSLVAGALLLSASAVAQVQDPIAVPATGPSGYDLLVQAGDKILPGPNGGPSNTDPAISPAEDLRRERLAVARNAPALALVREALQKPIAVPISTDYKDPGLRAGAQVRELSRQFSQEADVRAADGDFVGAMNSKLDTIEMGVAFERGNFISMLVGLAIESIGRKGVDKIAPHLNAAECRAALARLKAIEARRPSYSEVIQQEQLQTQTLIVSTLPDLKQANLTPEGRKNNNISEAEAAQIAALTPDKLRSDTSLVFAPIIESAGHPYNPSATIPGPAEINPLLKGTVEIFGTSGPRFNYERSRAASTLLMGALELRAQKLQSGVYPETFTPLTDPFSSEAKPLVYKKTNLGYLFYSVGPDGKDDQGSAIQTQETNPDTGVKTATSRLAFNSTGDIVQAPL